MRRIKKLSGYEQDKYLVRGGKCPAIGFPDDWLYLFVGIGRTSKFAVTRLVDKADRKTSWEFLEYLLKAVPYRIRTKLTD